MADLPELNEWTAGIYQLETSDPVLGGPEGIDNRQGKQLANRTIWLKAQLEQLGANKQASDATLTALSGLATEANQIIYSTGPDSFAMTALSAFIRTLLDDADAAAARTTLGAAGLLSPTFTGDPKAPTPPQFNNTDSCATTKFVNDTIGGLRRVAYSLTQGQVITPAMVNSLLYAGGTVNSATLPLLSSVPVGSTLTFAAISSSITLQRQGADTIWATSNASAMTSIAVNLGDTLTLTAAPFGWVCTGGSAMFAYQGNAGVFASLLTLNGYQKLPSGLIRQWGVVSTDANGLATATLPIAFPSSQLQAGCTYANGARNSICPQVASLTTTQIALFASLSTTGAAAAGAQLKWFADGC